ncbi:MAG TPA: polymer-forming cytoskeletal protein [Candidatus Binatia bacterium]|nr:polymer-forming cytoskeletal protein [Candidatus Binatia bacterium]
MSLFARRNEDAGIDMSPTVKDVTLAALPNSPLNEVRIEAEDDERNGRIGKGSRLAGKLVFEGSVRVYGEVEGEIVAGEAVIVRRGGKVNAKIHAREIVIEGEVTADVHATGKLEIGVTGRLTGTVRTPRLVIHEGAVFDGSCSMTGAPDEQDLVVPDALFEPAELNLAS